MCPGPAANPDTRTFRLRHFINDSPMTSVGPLKNSVSKAFGHIDLSGHNMEGSLK